MLHELGVDYETHRIESRTGETRTDAYLAMNPKGKIPVLVDKDLVLTESAAIIRHLRRRFDVLPYDDFQRSARGEAVYDEWQSFILMELDATSLYVVRRHRDLPALYGEADNAVRSSISYYERMLRAESAAFANAEFLWGSCFSELDILMTTSLEWGDYVGAEIPAVMKDYQARMKQRSAYQAAWADNFRGLQLPTGLEA